MKTLSILFATALVALSVHAKDFEDIAPAEVLKLAEAKKAVIIDVNGEESYKKGHVPGALSYVAIKDKFAESLPADKSTLIIAYCGSPKCKAYKKAAEAAVKLGYTNVKHMSAGISGWRKAGLKTE